MYRRYGLTHRPANFHSRKPTAYLRCRIFAERILTDSTFSMPTQILRPSFSPTLNKEYCEKSDGGRKKKRRGSKADFRALQIAAAQCAHCVGFAPSWHWRIHRCTTRAPAGLKIVPMRPGKLSVCAIAKTISSFLPLGRVNSFGSYVIIAVPSRLQGICDGINFMQMGKRTEINLMKFPPGSRLHQR